MKEYKTIKEDGVIEIDIKKSQFICHLKRVKTEDEVRTFINGLKKEHYKAIHNCSAFILGENAEIKRSSDDGEPSGTAGVPILTVLENHQLTDIVAVVTRYFGGIKLGAGGLIRAYAGAVAEAVKEIGCVQVKEQQGISVSLSYAQYQDFAKWCSERSLLEYDTQFLENVTTTLYVDKEIVQETMDSLVEYYHGKVSLEKIGTRIVEVPIN
ncbi:YigZ family protein [Streptococcus gallolyticus]|nr:YigZ family protein [Streptococcus gallolyticus]MBY5041955.1 YigZ family protein [Streptococcus gallolyticus]